MNTRANYAKLGSFVLAGTALGLTVALLLGGGALFKPRVLMETYMNQSVQGLDVGSKVKYRGVLLGQVKEISFTTSRYEKDQLSGQRRSYVLILMEVYPERIPGADGRRSAPSQAELDNVIRNGLRCRLASQGITGLSFIEMDFLNPADNPPLPLDWQPGNLYIPSAYSTSTRLLENLDKFVKRVDNLKVEETLSSLNGTLNTLNGKLAGLDVAGINSEAAALLTEVRQTNQALLAILGKVQVEKIQGDVTTVLADARTLIGNPDLAQSLRLLHDNLARLNLMLTRRDSDVTTAVDNLRQTTENLRALSENARQYPSGVLLGAPPPPAKTK